MAGPSTQTERSREQTSGVVERTYFDLVVDQFKKNRLAVFGLRVITFLILVAGYPADDAMVPKHALVKKPLSEIASFL